MNDWLLLGNEQINAVRDKGTEQTNEKQFLP